MRSFNEEILKEPNVYRTYEAITHYGLAIKELINEQCGDGIMSAIDFYLDVGTTIGKLMRSVVITLNGKFLPFIEQASADNGAPSPRAEDEFIAASSCSSMSGIARPFRSRATAASRRGRSPPSRRSPGPPGTPSHCSVRLNAADACSAADRRRHHHERHAPAPVRSPVRRSKSERAARRPAPAPPSAADAARGAIVRRARPPPFSRSWVDRLLRGRQPATALPHAPSPPGTAMPL